MYLTSQQLCFLFVYEFCTLLVHYLSILCRLEFSCIALCIIEKDVHHQWHAKTTIGRGNSQFKEKLMEILRMPYNQKEYEVLFHEFSYRKPMQRHRDLRGGIKVYDVGRLGKSYRDHYSGKLDMDLLAAFIFDFLIYLSLNDCGCDDKHIKHILTHCLLHFNQTKQA